MQYTLFLPGSAFFTCIYVYKVNRRETVKKCNFKLYVDIYVDVYAYVVCVHTCTCGCACACVEAYYGLQSVYTLLNFNGVTTPSGIENNTKHRFKFFPISIFMDVMSVNDSLMMADLTTG